MVGKTRFSAGGFSFGALVIKMQGRANLKAWASAHLEMQRWFDFVLPMPVGLRSP